MAVQTLRIASQLIDGIQAGLVQRGFEDVRPAHGFAFVRISWGDATTADVAEHLSVSKQAAAQLVHQLVERGYVERRRSPSDGRARLLVLTDRGRACTRAAEAAASASVAEWRDRLTAEQFAELRRVLRALVEPGPLRPSW